jgi:hypothetical protein
MALPGQKATKVKPDRTEPMVQKVIPEVKVILALQADRAFKVKKV